MELDIRPIELEITDDRYYQAVAILVDNLRFLRLVSEYGNKFIDGEALFQFGIDEGARMINAETASKMAMHFGFPPQFGFLIYTAMVYGQVTDECVASLEKIDWLLEYKLAKKHKKSLYSDYLYQKPFELKKIPNFRLAREWYWAYKPNINSYMKMAHGDVSLKETIRTAIRVYGERVSY